MRHHTATLQIGKKVNFLQYTQWIKMHHIPQNRTAIIKCGDPTQLVQQAFIC